MGESLEVGRSARLARQLRAGAAVALAIESESARGGGDAPFKPLELVTAIEFYVPMMEMLDFLDEEESVLQFGAEIVLYEVIAARVGFIDQDRAALPDYGSPAGGGYRSRDEIRGPDQTYGFGVALPPGFPVDVRLDWASVPGRRGDRVERATLSVTIL
jgi:hypothetical protein